MLQFNDNESAHYPQAWTDCESTGSWRVTECEGNSELYLEVKYDEASYNSCRYADVTKRRLFPFFYLLKTTEKEIVGYNLVKFYSSQSWIRERDLRVITITDNQCGG